MTMKRFSIGNLCHAMSIDIRAVFYTHNYCYIGQRKSLAACAQQNRYPLVSRISTWLHSFIIVRIKNWIKNIKSHWQDVDQEWRSRNVRELSVCLRLAWQTPIDVFRHFNRHKPILCCLRNRLQQTGNAADRTRSGRLRKTTPRENRFYDVIPT